ncbi:MAG TPA: hypothetical protein VGI74_18535 [Streptosporangiaceae bacterium]
MTAGGGRWPPGGTPRDLRSLRARPDGEWPGQVVSLGEIWHTEALIDALATSGTIPPTAANDPAATLLAAFIQDLDPSACTAPSPASAQPAEPDAAQRRGKRRTARPWPIPVRALATALAAAAAVVLVAVVQPPWPASGSRTATRPLAAQLQPAMQVRLPGQHHPSPDDPLLTGPAGLVPPPAAGDSWPSSSPAIPAGARSRPASTARMGLARQAGPAGAAHGFRPDSGLPVGAGPAHNGSVPAGRGPAWHSGPAAGHHGGTRRPPRSLSGPGGRQLQPGPRAPAPAGHGAVGPPHRGTRPSPAGGGTRPWKFWLRGTARAGAARALLCLAGTVAVAGCLVRCRGREPGAGAGGQVRIRKRYSACYGTG